MRPAQVTGLRPDVLQSKGIGNTFCMAKRTWEFPNFSPKNTNSFYPVCL